MTEQHHHGDDAVTKKDQDHGPEKFRKQLGCKTHR